MAVVNRGSHAIISISDIYGARYEYFGEPYNCIIIRIPKEKEEKYTKALEQLQRIGQLADNVVIWPSSKDLKNTTITIPNVNGSSEANKIIKMVKGQVDWQHVLLEL